MNKELTHQLIVHLRTALKPLGFKSKGASFVRDTGGLLQLLTIQKSVNSTQAVIKFTIEVGIYSKLFGAVLGGHHAWIPTSAFGCPLRSRINTFVSNQQDWWWTATNATGVLIASQAVTAILIRTVLPFLDAQITNEDFSANLKSSGPLGILDRELYGEILEKRLNPGTSGD